MHDTQPVRELATDLTDKLYGDKGYLSKALWQHRVPSKIAEMSQPLKGVIL
nr:transposase [Paraglaciecola agarilytica]